MRHSTSWNKSTRFFVLSLVVGMLLIVMYQVRFLLAPISIAALLGFLLYPLAKLLQQRLKCSWNIAVTVVYTVVLLILFGGFAVLSPLLIRQIQIVSFELQALLEMMSNSAEITIFSFQLPTPDLTNRITAAAATFIQPGQIVSALRSISTNLTWVLTSLFCTFYFLRDGDRIASKLITLAPPQVQSDLRQLLKEIVPVWQAYLRGQFVLMLIIGVTTGIGAAALGIESALIIGIIAGAFDIIPTVGPAIAAIIALAITAFEGSSWIPLPSSFIVLLVFVLFGVIQTAENVWLRPRIMGSRVNLHPAVIFVGIVAAITFSGALLALFIIPLIRTVQIVLNYIRLRVYGMDPWVDTSIPRNNQP